MKMKASLVLLASCAAVSRAANPPLVGDAAAAAVPTVALKNAAVPGLMMPAVGLGTGAYSDNVAVGYGGYPECWAEIDPKGKVVGCGGFAVEATLKWIRAGGRRIDAANSYQNQHAIGQAMALSQVPREEFFLLSKVGPSNPLGYNDSLKQFDTILSDMGTSYVDLVLIHWPVDSSSQGNVTNPDLVSTDPLCNKSMVGVYDEKACRLDTWRALVSIFNSGKARSIGVSNYNSSQLQEIIDAGLPLPALTQNPYHIYRSSSQADTVAFCRAHDITFLAYSPLGVPDDHIYPIKDASGAPTGMSASQLTDPVVTGIAAKYGRTPAQVILAWLWAVGIPTNPRSMSEAHMIENLNYFDIALTPAEVAALSSRPQDACAADQKWYECSNTTSTTSPGGAPAPQVASPMLRGL